MKTITLTDNWCRLVSKGINRSPEEVRTMVYTWWNSGIGVVEIERKLFLMAREQGKDLVFAKKQGTN